MEAYPRKVQAVFEGSIRYLVPLFQRPYVWRRSQHWEPLWEDVLRIAEHYLANDSFRPHFMGAIVVSQVPLHAGGGGSREVFDGQQRLTTLQLMIAAARDASRLLGPAGQAGQSRLNALTLNGPARDAGAEAAFKVWPTNADRDDFRRVMRAGSPEAVREYYGSGAGAPTGQAIADAYIFFHERIAGWLGHEPVARLAALQNALQHGLVLVVIDLDERDDAQVIFETLNARGAPLHGVDLVKNLLLRMAEGQRLDVPRLYRSYWQAFDEGPFWRAPAGPSHSTRPRVDAFLQHYVTMATRAEVPAGNVFGAFREYVRQGGRGIEEELACLRRHADAFEAFSVPDPASHAARFFRWAAVLDAPALYPLLLCIYDRLPAPQRDAGWASMLRDLESFLVRRMICGLKPQGAGRRLLEGIGILESRNADLPGALSSFLLSGAAEAARWPDDRELRRSFASAPLYRRLTRSRLRLLLEALELGLAGGTAGGVGLPASLRIACLMPEGGGTAEDGLHGERAATQSILAHTIGNLTLVPQRVFPIIANGPWEKTRTAILSQGLALNRELPGLPGWGDRQIAERSISLFDAAAALWPYPGAPLAAPAESEAEPFALPPV